MPWLAGDAARGRAGGAGRYVIPTVWLPVIGLLLLHCLAIGMAPVSVAAVFEPKPRAETLPRGEPGPRHATSRGPTARRAGAPLRSGPRNT